jgi:hypothetical protein
MNLFVAVVVIASIPFVAVGLIRLAVRVLAHEHSFAEHAPVSHADSTHEH